MEIEEEKNKGIIKLFQEQSLSAKPSETSLERVLRELPVTEESPVRYNNQEVNIISPFYYYMSNTMKVLVSVVVIALLAGGAAYFKLAAPSDDSATVATEGSSFSQVESSNFEDSATGDIDSLLASFEEEQSEEATLLAVGDVDATTLANESTLVGEINQTYQDEI
ncbi:MAG: hypothetical protein WCV68_00260 [Candidatus Paceibacterota bacterium]|jgi:hypothetical protein